MEDKKIAYILSRFPVLTETFITKEIEELRSRGITVEVFSLKGPNLNDTFHPNTEKLIATTHYYPFFFSLMIWKNLFSCIGAKPWTCLKILMKIIGMNVLTPVLLIKSLAVIPKAFTISVTINKLNIKKIHSHWANMPTTVAWIVSIMNKIDFTFTAHAWDIFLPDKMLEEKITKARTVITCTKFNKKYLVENFPNVNPSKIVVIYHGIGFKQFIPLKDNRNPVFTILCIGRLAETKGIQILLPACSKLRERAIPFLCQIIYVHGDYEEKIFQIHESLHLNDCVEFIPAMPQEKLLDFYRNADCFVLPCIVTSNGDRDGIPNVILESLAMELPIVSTPVSGIPEVVINGVTGLIVGERNVEELADVMEKLYNDRELRKELGRNGRQLIEREFDIVRNIDLLEKIILGTGSRKRSHDGGKIVKQDSPAG